MERDCNIGILGAGPAGCCAAYFLQKDYAVTLIDYSSPLKTLLPTGGGRCNLAHAEYDFKQLAENYPRGEKFLYSVFSKFSTINTQELFEEIGIPTYIQEDLRIFPTSNSAADVRNKFLKKLNNVTIKKERGLRIEPIQNGIKLITNMNSYTFDYLIIAIGGHASYDILSRIGIDIIPPCPALVGLQTEEDLKIAAGISIKNILCEGLTGDILFTHNGISGPLIYKISSLKARTQFPYKLSLNLHPNNINLQELLNNNPHKLILNLIAEILPKKVATLILNKANINPNTKCYTINAKARDSILDTIHKFQVKIIGVRKDGEVVTAGGVNLNEINPKTMESKKIKGLYFIGEVVDIDGFCGGFNLQNCWSTAFVASDSILNS